MMLKPKKRKKPINIMHGICGGVVGYRGDVRFPIGQDVIEGILLIYSPSVNYPSAPKVVNRVLELVRTGYVKTKET
ncbi:hypothetical protein PWL12_002485 [Salmonella enterica]|nr:hypothetical protein [Salmonella enterica]